jgi:Pyruvate/2-oxoacid:ferredoxin oxidoreductase delta subunit
MSNDIYERLANALDKLPNGFPRTPSKVEIQLLKKIFSVDEASVVSQLSRSMESVEVIAERIGLTVQEARTRLMDLARRGLVWFDKQGGIPRFRLAPFIVGIYEAQLANMDHDFAHLIEQYMAEGGAAGIMKPQPALHRVIPAQSVVKSEWVLPYDDVRAILLNAKTFNVRDCICRVQQDHIGRRCNFPLRNCLSFSSVDRSPNPDDISQEEALAILDQAEEAGLVHTVSNVAKEFGYVCNCCGCCCGILRGITEWGIDNSVAYANYYAVINLDTCTGCATCRIRCQVRAISEKDGVSTVNLKSCIGCGLCVSGCPDEAAKLYRKPEAEIVHPPADFATWEHQRLVNRGLIE